jgi:uncharacterized phage protein gp47/JayE
VADIPIDYTAADYADIVVDLLRRAEQVVPEWTSRSQADFGVVLAEQWAHAADLNNYAIDRMLRESFLPTAITRESILTLAGMLSYVSHANISATGTVTLVSDSDAVEPIVVPAGTRLSSVYVEAIDSPVIFETVAEATVPPAGGEVVVDIAEGETTTKLQIGISNGKPSQRVSIGRDRVIEGSVRLHVEAEHADLEWTRLTRLVFAGPTDLAFAVRPDALGGTVVALGDGVNGAIPQLGARIYATFKVGVGMSGNLSAGKIEFLDSDIAGVSIAYDGAGVPISSAMSGGTGHEDTEQIRRFAPAAFSARERAVTVADYEAVALTVPGVTAARAISQLASSMVVYIAGPDRSVPSPELIIDAQEQLSLAAMGGVTVTVGGPTLVGVNLGTVGTPVRVFAAPTWRNDVVDQAVRTQLTNLLRSTTLSLGSRVTVGQIYTSLAVMPGVININIPMMARADAVQSGIDDIVLSPWELPVLGDVELVTTGGVE